MPRFDASQIPDLSGYVIIVTGGNSGIGHETSFQLAAHGARVYIAARSPDRVAEAIKRMQAASPNPLDLHALNLDLQILQSVTDAAKTFTRLESRLDILINNAGIMAVPFAKTIDNFERQWQTNYLAPFLLTRCLLPLMQSTARASPPNRVRIVNVSSDAAVLTAPKNGLDLKDPNLEDLKGPTSAWKRYGHSKLASVHHAHILHARLAPSSPSPSSSSVAAFSVHPGIVSTNLQAADPTVFGSLLRHLVRWGVVPGTVSVAEGARTTLLCAVGQEAAATGEEKGGGVVDVYGGRFVREVGKVDVRGDKLWAGETGRLTGERLWAETERMLAEAGFPA